MTRLVAFLRGINLGNRRLTTLGGEDHTMRTLNTVRRILRKLAE